MKVFALCVLVAVVAALAGSVEPARACSCIPPDPWTFLRQADGAFVGSLVSRREASEGRVVLTFRVERAVKGEIGATVEVATANNGAACGIETSVGKRIGLFLAREGGKWIGHLCWQVAPEDLLAAAALPAPNGRGPVAMFVGGRFGPARMIALDAKGRTLAYGMGAGYVLDSSMCPGGRRVAELAELNIDKSVVTIRELPSLRFIRQQVLEAAFAGPVRCTAAEGDRVVVFVGSGPDLGQRARLLRLTPTTTATIWRGRAFSASLARRFAYVTDVNAGLLAVDIRNGSVKRVALRTGGAHNLTPNPSGTRFASLAYTEGVGNPRLVLVDTRRRSGSVRNIPLPNAAGVVIWLVDGRLALLQNPTAFVFGRDLRVVSRFRWSADYGAIVGATAFGVHRVGRLVSAKLPSGPARLVRRLPGRPHLIISASG